jgi:Domain of unknown function (DUF4381)
MSATVSDPTSLENFFDIVAPPSVPWWPPAPGWCVVGGIMLILSFWVAWQGWRRWRAAAYRRAALAEWRQLKTQANDSGLREATLQHLPELVKRVALAAFPREAVASLSGEAWLRFLDSSGHTDAFTHGRGQLLPALAYDPKLIAQLDMRTVDDLFRVVQCWIRDHSTAVDSQMIGAPSEPIPARSADRERFSIPSPPAKGSAGEGT